MYVKSVKTNDGFDRKTTFELGLSLEELMPNAAGLDYDVATGLVGRTYRISIITRTFDGKASDYYARTRIFPDVPNVLGEHPEYTTRGDDPANDKAWDEFNRNEVRVMKALARAFMPLISALTVGPADPKLGFSRKAGCSMCPCSPGLIVRDERTLRFGTSPCDIWISEVKER